MSVHRIPPHRRWHGGVRGFVHRYGWRAYALPILSVVTVVVLVHGTSTTVTGLLEASPRSAAGSATSFPRGAAVPASGSGLKVEGRNAQDAGFAAGSTPAPVVIDLGDDGVSCATNTYSRLILVSISKQHLWVCRGARQVSSTAVTTGAKVDHDQTPLGSWRVQAKQRNRYLVGPGYKDYVHYWVPFNGDFGLHDAPWQTMRFGSPQWPTRGSHGCVHVPTKTMAWLYRWATVGGTVVTVEH